MTAAEARERLERGINRLQFDDEDLLILRLRYVDLRDRVELDAEVWLVACIGAAFGRPREVEEHRASSARASQRASPNSFAASETLTARVPAVSQYAEQCRPFHGESCRTSGDRK